MKYKTIMLDIESYSKLASARDKVRKRLGKKLSFNETILALVSGQLEFAEIDDALKDFITRFVENVADLDFVIGAVLFGSVAKGTYNRYSDIDILLLVKSKNRETANKILSKITEMRKESYSLMDKDLPSLINPVIIEVNDMEEFRPFYLDVADYGIILYERGRRLSKFIYALKRMKHVRENVHGLEVLTWA
jgi:predicted nucleotidyltransferase